MIEIRHAAQATFLRCLHARGTRGCARWRRSMTGVRWRRAPPPRPRRRPAAHRLSRSASDVARTNIGCRTRATASSPAARSPPICSVSGSRTVPAPTGSANRQEHPQRRVCAALGADGWMFDGEDALGQVATMSLDNQRSLKLAIHRDPLFLKVAEEVSRK